MQKESSSDESESSNDDVEVVSVIAMLKCSVILQNLIQAEIDEKIAQIEREGHIARIKEKMETLSRKNLIWYL